MPNASMPVQVNVAELVKKLRESGKDITEETINLNTDPTLETAEWAETARAEILEFLKPASSAPYEVGKPSLNAWQRAAILYKIGRL